ncbi:MAG: GNAT family N-acetyltransferase [candidate division KSB1 bacterium]|nr:GNAT family N-acetyltransferase [candidate division KSB1 bacterium]
MVPVRPLEPSDIPELLALWSSSFPYDPLNPELVREKIWQDPDFDPDLNVGVVRGGRLVAFVSAVSRPQYAPGIGWIKLVALPLGQGETVAVALLEEIESRLAQRGARVVQLFDSAPNYLLPGLDPRYTAFLAFAEEHGYRRFDCTANLEAPLAGKDFDTAGDEARLASQGIEVRRAGPEDWEATIAALSRYFPQWVPEARRTFDNDPVSLHLALYKGRVVGFAAYDANNLGTGWFGPMGTHPRWRGRGIGRVLYLRCLRDLQAQGHTKAIIPWVGPIGFYFRVSGATVVRVFWRYRKRVNRTEEG